MTKSGFISPFKTTLRCHLGRTSWVRRDRMLILRMMLWIVSSCSAVGGFNLLRTLAMEALWTLMGFTCLFFVNRWTRYSARVTYERSLDCMPLSLAHLAKFCHWELYKLLDESLKGSAANYTTVSVKWCCLRRTRKRTTRLDPKGEICGTGGKA